MNSESVPELLVRPNPWNHKCELARVNENDNPAFEIVEAARKVHRTLGPGFLESIYNKALVAELRTSGIPVQREKQIKIWYGSQVVGQHRLDIVVGDVIVELKANRGIVGVHKAQMRSYLQASSQSCGVIINFGMPELEWELVRTTD